MAQSEFVQPNLGNTSLKLVAKDDAKFVHLVPIKDIANGTVAMPFCHPVFLAEYFAKYYPDSRTALRLSFVKILAQIRNIRLMKKINVVLMYINKYIEINLHEKRSELIEQFIKASDAELKEMITGLFSNPPVASELFSKQFLDDVAKEAHTIAKNFDYTYENDFNTVHNLFKPHTITEEMEAQYLLRQQTFDQCKLFGVDTTLYTNEEADFDDISSCVNAWNLAQNVCAGKASDSVKIITDLDGVQFLVAIERQFGPGKNQYAFAGGFVDPNESFVEAAKREESEETELTLKGKVHQYKETTFVLTPVHSQFWDPRAKFVEGMENGGLVTHWHFRK